MERNIIKRPTHSKRWRFLTPTFFFFWIFMFAMYTGEQRTITSCVWAHKSWVWHKFRSTAKSQLMTSDGVAVGREKSVWKLKKKYIYILYNAGLCSLLQGLSHTHAVSIWNSFQIQWPRFFFFFDSTLFVCVYLRTDSLFLSQWASRAHTHTRNEGYL